MCLVNLRNRGGYFDVKGNSSYIGARVLHSFAAGPDLRGLKIATSCL